MQIDVEIDKSLKHQNLVKSNFWPIFLLFNSLK